MKNLLFILLIYPFFSSASTLTTKVEKQLSMRLAQPINGEQHHIIDIGFFYTKDLMNTLSQEQLTTHIERQINAANVVMENSELPLRRRVLYIGEYPIDNQSNMAIDDFLATVYEDQANQIRSLAQQFGFDYITILRPQSDVNYCGWAYYNSPYAIMEVGGNCTSATLGAHEWGHNDGADHDIANSSDTPLTEYARGYNCAGNGTIMSTNHNWFTRHDFYSSPDIKVEGEACGDEKSANIVRMLNEFKDVAGYLGNRLNQPESLANVIINNSNVTLEVSEGEQATIEIILVDLSGAAITLDRDASVEIFSQSNSAIADSDFNTLVERIIFKAGENSKNVSVTTLADGIAEPTESFSLSLRHGDIIVPSEESITLSITENSGQLSYQFAVSSLSIQSENSAFLEISRSGFLSKISEVKISHQLSWLAIDNETLSFTEDQATIMVNVSVNQLSSTRRGDIILSSLDDSTTYDTVTVTGVVVATEKSSGGASGNLLSMMLLIVLSRLCKHCKLATTWSNTSNCRCKHRAT